MKINIYPKKSSERLHEYKFLFLFYKRVFSPRLFGLFGLIFLGLLSAVLEVVVIGFVLPFVSLLTGKPSAFESSMLAQKFVSPFLGGIDFQNLLEVSFLFAVLIFCSSFLKVVLTWTQSHYCQYAGMRLAEDIFDTLISEDFEKQKRRRPEAIMASILAKIDTVVNACIVPLISFVNASVISISIIILLLSKMPQVSLALLFALFLVYGIFASFSKKLIWNFGDTIQSEQTIVSRTLNDYFSNLRAVFVDNLAPYFISRFQKSNFLIRDSFAKIQFLSTFPKHVIEGLGIILIVLLTVIFHYKEGNGVEVLASIGFLAMAGQRLLPQANTIYSSWAAISSSMAAVNEVLSLLDREPSSENTRNQKINFEEKICLNDVSFKYQQSDRLALKDINIEIVKGEMVAIVGKSGSGKSTLLDILIGLLHPTSGKVFIDNKELTGKYIKDWQNKFSYAEQNTLLLNDSVVNNIKFSLPNTSLSKESFQDALKICSVWDEVLALPDGINTFLGEKGNAVSGGQKQRIGMARAIYKNSEILIFDEPTSGLDEATEIEVIKNLKRHLFGRTVIVVTHSKAVQGFCDRIINIDI